MSKKPHKSRHRVPVLPDPESAILDERYQREVDYSTSRLQRVYRKAASALAAAEKRAEKARVALERNTRNVRLRRDHERLVSLVEDRRRELREVAALMTPESHGTRDSHRRQVRQEAGAILIPLGDTTGHKKRLKIPKFPVVVEKR